MRSLMLAAALAGCWRSTEVIREVPVYRVRYLHDVPPCTGLPEFPPVSELEQPGYVDAVSAWVVHASACLAVRAYPIRDLLVPRQWSAP